MGKLFSGKHYRKKSAKSRLSEEITKMSRELNARMQKLEAAGLEGMSAELAQIQVINEEFGKQGIKNVVNELTRGVKDKKQKEKITAAYYHKLKAALDDPFTTVEGAQKWLDEQDDPETALAEIRDYVAGVEVEFRYSDTLAEVAQVDQIASETLRDMEAERFELI